MLYKGMEKSNESRDRQGYKRLRITDKRGMYAAFSTYSDSGCHPAPKVKVGVLGYLRISSEEGRGGRGGVRQTAELAKYLPF